MGSNSVANASKFVSDTTIVLVGCTGSGKSATGNSILGRKAFTSMFCFGSVTNACERQATVLKDGRILNVIDTPGLFDSSSEHDFTEKEITKCMDMAGDGIHAILMVISLKVRFSEEQVAAVETMKHLFGPRIVEYMIVAFTGADDLEEDVENLDDFLASTCPQPLKELLDKCGNRRVVFDNETKDQTKKAEQLDQLLTLISNTVVKNGGKPYTRDLFLQAKNEAAKRDQRRSKQQMLKEHDDEQQVQMRVDAMVHEKLKEREETMKKKKQDLERLQREANEQVKRREDAKNEIRRLREQLVKTQGQRR